MAGEGDKHCANYFNEVIEIWFSIKCDECEALIVINSSVSAAEQHGERFCHLKLGK